MSAFETIKALNIVPVQEMTEDCGIVTFLDYCYPAESREAVLDNQHIDEDGKVHGPMTRDTGIEDNEYHIMGLKVKEKTINLVPEVVPLVDTTEDPCTIITTHILKKLICKISELATEHKSEIDSKLMKSFDVEVVGTEEMSSRKVIARILACGNLIAVSGRRGPANLIISSQEMLDFIRFNPKSGYIYEPEYKMAGLKMLACNDLGNTIIVLRSADMEAPGIHLFMKGDSQEDYTLNDTNTDMKEVIVKYAIEVVGDRAKYNYMQFDVKFIGN